MNVPRNLSAEKINKLRPWRLQQGYLFCAELWACLIGTAEVSLSSSSTDRAWRLWTSIPDDGDALGVQGKRWCRFGVWSVLLHVAREESVARNTAYPRGYIAVAVFSTSHQCFNAVKATFQPAVCLSVAGLFADLLDRNALCWTG